VLSPAAAAVRPERWQALSPEERRTRPPLCPDLVIELASASDSGPSGAEAMRLEAGDVLPGLVMDLEEIWAA